MTPEQSRRAIFLNEVGIGNVWVRRHVTTPPMPETVQTEVTEIVPEIVPEIVRQTEPPEPVMAAIDAPAFETDFSAWDESPPMPPAFFDDEMDMTQVPYMPPSADAVAGMDWPQLKAAVASCRGCKLCEGRTQTVFGVGDQQARWLFVGEGPGREEDMQGEPFVGPAGKLLNNMLLAMGLRRNENVYLANAVKCRATDASGADHAPTAAEIAACKPYLERQIALIQPTVIVALGKTAALSLLGPDAGKTMAALRGSVHQHDGRPLIVTYHPSYLLRKPTAKREAWADLCLALNTYAGA